MAAQTWLGNRAPCPLHGHWVCSGCGWRRQQANRFYDKHRCHRCGSSVGVLHDIVHRELWRHETCLRTAETFIKKRANALKDRS